MNCQNDINFDYDKQIKQYDYYIIKPYLQSTAAGAVNEDSIINIIYKIVA